MLSIKIWLLSKVRFLYQIDIIFFVFRSFFQRSYQAFTNTNPIICSKILKNVTYSSGFLLFPLSKNFFFKTAQCERFKSSHKSRVTSLHQQIQSKKDPKFNWGLLWDLMKPDILWFIFAAGCAFAVAIVNVKIPLLLGDLVNSITSLLRHESEVILYSSFLVWWISPLHLCNFWTS